MSLLDSFFLGLLQGVGEFLPISSSAHLRLYSFLVGIEYQGLFFDVMLHLGTLFAVFIYFWGDIKQIIKSLIKKDRKVFMFVLSLSVATIPGVVAGFFLEDYAEGLFREVYSVGISLIVFSFLIAYIDRKFGIKDGYKDFNPKDALIAGLFQATAIIPGASRSAMSICGLLLCGYSRFEAARISFFMSMPIILGASVFEIKKVGRIIFEPYLIVGFLSSFLFGIISIRFLLSILKKTNLNIFVFYRILLGIVVLVKWLYER